MRRDRHVVAELYGRRLYEVMKVWETYGTGPDATTVERDYGEIWRDRDKVVFSTTLPSVDTKRTRLERAFDADAVRDYVDSLEGDVNIGGPELAAHAIRAGVVDLIEYYVHPIIVGGGTPWLPADVSVRLRLVEQRRFRDGVIYLSYDVRRA